MRTILLIFLVIALSGMTGSDNVAKAEIGDPQLGTDHPWYPGELAISDFGRLFKTQADVYRSVTGRSVESDEDKALASWLWRNTHFWHGEAGGKDLWGKGLGQGDDRRLREYWTGLFAYGFGLCGTTHSQWTAELDALLGHARGRGVGAAGHNAFEVFLKDTAYGPDGRWALLDHDLSTVIFDKSGRRLLGLGEIQPNVDQWIRRDFLPDRQHGWLVCGLHPGDGESYRSYAVAEYLAGYAGPPPMVHLRRGERMRRYFQPGLDDGKTFVFWGRNYNTAGIPGPERSRSWVNQPDLMFGSNNGTPHRDGQVRFANVQYLYRPDFNTGDYREAVVRESDSEVIFEFRTPYVIAATPPNDQPWGIYDQGCKNGLTVRGDVPGEVAVSIDAGRHWSPSQRISGQLDLTDHVKGHGQYWLRVGCSASDLRGCDLLITTNCQANVAVLPRLKDNGTTVRYEASNQKVTSMGPEWDLANSFITEGKFGDPMVEMKSTPDTEVRKIYAAAHLASGSPPDPNVRYQIEYRAAGSTNWHPVVKDWSIVRRGDEPGDFWSQSLCYGASDVDMPAGKSVSVRFRNDGSRRVLRAEVHFVQSLPSSDPVRVTYAWSDSVGEHTESTQFDQAGEWKIGTASNVQTHWVEMTPAPRPVVP
ncbi:MAG: hypothetical protein KDB00_09970 [Planctomycetales bacterium]|nr:hypothetical protein [Planctomycetales bacterium]